jgi:quercetin dioxygenase-like cupin family protein
MKFLAAAALSAVLAFSQTVVANHATARWVQEGGSESVTLREDPRTGAIEMLVRYPPGHVFKPHWHNANERMVLIEGRMSLRQGDGPETFLEPGGYAFLPAKEVQRTACVSKTRCAFYVYWDAKLDFHPAP